MQKLQPIWVRGLFRVITDQLCDVREEVINHGRQRLVDHRFHRQVSDALSHGERLGAIILGIPAFHVPLAYS